MTVEQILELARGLSPVEQQRLLEDLKNLTFSEDTNPQNRYKTLLDLAGSAHSEYQDVSGNKLQHLSEAYTVQ